MPFPKRKKNSKRSLCSYCRDDGVEFNPDLGNEDSSNDEKSERTYRCRRYEKTFPTYIEQ